MYTVIFVPIRRPCEMPIRTIILAVCFTRTNYNHDRRQWRTHVIYYNAVAVQRERLIIGPVISAETALGRLNYKWAYARACVDRLLWTYSRDIVPWARTALKFSRSDSSIPAGIRDPAVRSVPLDARAKTSYGKLCPSAINIPPLGRRKPVVPTRRTRGFTPFSTGPSSAPRKNGPVSV